MFYSAKAQFYKCTVSPLECIMKNCDQIAEPKDFECFMEHFSNESGLQDSSIPDPPVGWELLPLPSAPQEEEETSRSAKNNDQPGPSKQAKEGEDGASSLRRKRRPSIDQIFEEDKHFNAGYLDNGGRVLRISKRNNPVDYSVDLIGSDGDAEHAALLPKPGTLRKTKPKKQRVQAHQSSGGTETAPQDLKASSKRRRKRQRVDTIRSRINTETVAQASTTSQKEKQSKTVNSHDRNTEAVSRKGKTSKTMDGHEYNTEEENVVRVLKDSRQAKLKKKSVHHNRNSEPGPSTSLPPIRPQRIATGQSVNEYYYGDFDADVDSDNDAAAAHMFKKKKQNPSKKHLQQSTLLDSSEHASTPNPWDTDGQEEAKADSDSEYEERQVQKMKKQTKPTKRPWQGDSVFPTKTSAPGSSPLAAEEHSRDSEMQVLHSQDKGEQVHVTMKRKQPRRRHQQGVYNVDTNGNPAPGSFLPPVAEEHSRESETQGEHSQGKDNQKRKKKKHKRSKEKGCKGSLSPAEHENTVPSPVIQPQNEHDQAQDEQEVSADEDHFDGTGAPLSKLWHCYFSSDRSKNDLQDHMFRRSDVRLKFWFILEQKENPNAPSGPLHACVRFNEPLSENDLKRILCLEEFERDNLQLHCSKLRHGEFDMKSLMERFHVSSDACTQGFPTPLGMTVDTADASPERRAGHLRANEESESYSAESDSDGSSETASYSSCEESSGAETVNRTSAARNLWSRDTSARLPHQQNTDISFGFACRWNKGGGKTTFIVGRERLHGKKLLPKANLKRIRQRRLEYPTLEPGVLEAWERHRDNPPIERRVFEIVLKAGWLPDDSQAHLTSCSLLQLLFPSYVTQTIYKSASESLLDSIKSRIEDWEPLWCYEEVVSRIYEWLGEGEVEDIIKPFIVQKPSEEVPILVKGFNLAKVSFEQLQDLVKRNQVVSLIEACERCGVFLIMEEAIGGLTVDLMDWLEQNKTVVAEISGRDTKGERHVILSDYAARLGETSRQEGRIGTFNVVDRGKQADDVDKLLRQDWGFSNFLPWGLKGGLGQFLQASGQSQTLYGPMTFGGEKSRTFQSQSSSRRQTSWSGFEGSTMHLDGMGTSVAAGGLKDGLKLVTAVDARDALLALKVAGFTTYAKPGGSAHIVNAPITNQIRRSWARLGVRFASFEVKRGDGYLIPCGIPHEFKNMEPSLSIAWNYVPHPKLCLAALGMLSYSLHELDQKMKKQPCRLQHALDFIPEYILVRMSKSHLERLEKQKNVEHESVL